MENGHRNSGDFPQLWRSWPNIDVQGTWTLGKPCFMKQYKGTPFFSHSEHCWIQSIYMYVYMYIWHIWFSLNICSFPAYRVPNTVGNTHRTIGSAGTSSLDTCLAEAATTYSSQTDLSSVLFFCKTHRVGVESDIRLLQQKLIWLVVWKMFIFSFSWEFHHPNWLNHIFFRGVDLITNYCFLWITSQTSHVFRNLNSVCAGLQQRSSGEVPWYLCVCVSLFCGVENPAWISSRPHRSPEPWKSWFVEGKSSPFFWPQDSG